jgi:O-antigen ligase
VPIFSVALTLLLGWGALAMGGLPSWAAAPILVFAITTGILGFLEPGSNPSRTSFRHAGLLAAMALFIAAIGVQLVPLPEPMVKRLSPARVEFEYERLLAIADRRDPAMVPLTPNGAARPLSIAPSRTLLGLAGVAGFAIFLFGAARGFSRVGVRGISRPILILGVLVTFIGIYRIANGTVALYGLYVPLSPARESAPFINRNHQAGWLAMVLALGLGALAGEVARGMRGVPPTWRDRLLWLSSKQANVAALMLFASVIIAIGMLTTQSRSGAAALATVFVVIIGWSLWKQPTKVRRRAFGIGLILVLLAVISYAGEGVARRLAITSWDGMDGRVAIWRDTTTIADKFWLTGSGFNTFGVAMLRYQTSKDAFRYIEAHNDYLQLAAEGGLLVGIPAIILAITLIAAIFRRFRDGADDTRTYWLRVGAVAAICAIAVQSVTDFTLQIPGAFAMFATILAIAIHHPRPRHSKDVV